MRAIWISLILIMIVFKSFGQSISDSAFDLMLDGLLANSVEMVNVDSIENSDGVVWLDCREKKEFDVSHLKSAKWVGYDDFDIERLNGFDKDANIIVYCSVGYRSEKVGEKLESAGFKNVKNLYGGIFSWKNDEKPVYDSLGNETENVHAYNRIWGVWLKKGKKVY
ncbi:MAG: rhodanese-like domain-containing protein [Cyclobacteriaceae bacterium]